MQYDQPFSNISMSTFSPVGVAPWIFDIYRDPKERITRSNGDYEWLYGPILSISVQNSPLGGADEFLDCLCCNSEVPAVFRGAKATE